jgi:chromosome segregation ATPase
MNNTENQTTSQKKIRSFRIEDETYSRFTKLSEEFPNQSAALESLIGAWEMQNAKAVLSNMETDITDFESNLKAVQSAFLHVLELNHNAEKRIRTEFSAQLKSKDMTIIELQERITQADETATQARLVADEVAQHANEQSQEQANEVAELLERVDRAEQARQTAEQTAQTAETARQAVAETLLTVREQLDEVKLKVAKTDELSKKLAESEERAKKAESELASVQEKIKSNEEKFNLKLQIESERANAMQVKAVSEERAKAMEESKKLYSQINDLNTRIRELMESNHRLSEENSKLNSKLEN